MSRAIEHRNRKRKLAVGRIFTFIVRLRMKRSIQALKKPVQFACTHLTGRSALKCRPTFTLRRSAASTTWREAINRLRVSRG